MYSHSIIWSFKCYRRELSLFPSIDYTVLIFLIKNKLQQFEYLQILHFQEHLNPDNDIEQLGCQACGRVFFGSGGRIDLIGHLRTLHQDDFLQNVLKCPRAEKLGQDITTINTTNNDGNDNTCHESIKSCKAHFSSPRLRQLHISMLNNNNSNTLSNTEFSCPILFNEKQYLTDQIKNLILQTEIAADQSGIMILAFCCPNCSRLFVGDNVHTR